MGVKISNLSKNVLKACNNDTLEILQPEFGMIWSMVA